MWQVETKNKWQIATIELDEGQYGKGLEVGKEGGEKKGFSFDFITSQIGAKPILSAVTELQFKTWQNAVIIAVPARFLWK